jgi:hypothetical protein
LCLCGSRIGRLRGDFPLVKVIELECCDDLALVGSHFPSLTHASLSSLGDGGHQFNLLKVLQNSIQTVEVLVIQARDFWTHLLTIPDEKLLVEANALQHLALIGIKRLLVARTPDYGKPLQTFILKEKAQPEEIQQMLVKIDPNQLFRQTRHSLEYMHLPSPLENFSHSYPNATSLQ